MVDLTAFYGRVKDSLFYGSLPDWQRIPMDTIIAEGLRRERRLEDCAYVLATAYHETARFKYDEEIGQGSGKAYGQPCPLMGTGSKVTEWRTYYGRSWPQHTWLANYAKLSVRATLEFQREIDFVSNPDLIKDDSQLEAWAMWEGMVSGLWTGKNLADYIHGETVDYVNARRIVNGTDKAETIAGYAREFEAALRLVDDTQEQSKCPLHNTTCPLNQ